MSHREHPPALSRVCHEGPGASLVLTAKESRTALERNPQTTANNCSFTEGRNCPLRSETNNEKVSSGKAEALVLLSQMVRHGATKSFLQLAGSLGISTLASGTAAVCCVQMLTYAQRQDAHTAGPCVRHCFLSYCLTRLPAHSLHGHR